MHNFRKRRCLIGISIAVIVVAGAFFYFDLNVITETFSPATVQLSDGHRATDGLVPYKMHEINSIFLTKARASDLVAFRRRLESGLSLSAIERDWEDRRSLLSVYLSLAADDLSFLESILLNSHLVSKDRGLQVFFLDMGTYYIENGAVLSSEDLVHVLGQRLLKTADDSVYDGWPTLVRFQISLVSFLGATGTAKSLEYLRQFSDNNPSYPLGHILFYFRQRGDG